ncbi:hypothetical protein BD410DRAFT_805964 [Rickenella mellea]|uniref:Uncharacterized protein n=1 Tax=Rickenella mellea TaxID=50990 RepID=A0A4Y7PVL7_9AGAM|nr:hypothetical protein BD410DRAFT_805964 [Rickenella mellea]
MPNPQRTTAHNSDFFCKPSEAFLLLNRLFLTVICSCTPTHHAIVVVRISPALPPSIQTNLGMFLHFPRVSGGPHQSQLIPPKWDSKIWFVYISIPNLNSQAVQHFTIGVADHNGLISAPWHCVGPTSEHSLCDARIKRQFDFELVGTMEDRDIITFRNIVRSQDTDGKEFCVAIGSQIEAVLSFYRCWYHFQRKLHEIFLTGIVKWYPDLLKSPVQKHRDYERKLHDQFRRATGLNVLAVIEEKEKLRVSGKR